MTGRGTESTHPKKPTTKDSEMPSEFETRLVAMLPKLRVQALA